MDLPFTLEQFYDVFRQYNELVWPAWRLALRRSPGPHLARCGKGFARWRNEVGARECFNQALVPGALNEYQQLDQSGV